MYKQIMNLEDVHYYTTLFTFFTMFTKNLRNRFEQAVAERTFFYERDSTCLPCLQVWYLRNWFQQALAQ